MSGRPVCSNTPLQLVFVFASSILTPPVWWKALFYRNHHGLTGNTAVKPNIWSLTTFKSKRNCITLRWLPHFNGWTFHSWPFMWPWPADVANAWCCPNQRPLRTWKFKRSKPWNKESWNKWPPLHMSFGEKQHVLFSVKEEAFIVVILCRHNWMKSKSWIWSCFIDTIWNQGSIVTWYIGNWELGSKFFWQLEDQGKLMVISTFWMGISSEQTLTTTTSNLFPRKLSRYETYRPNRQWWPNLLRFLLRWNRFRLKHTFQQVVQTSFDVVRYSCFKSLQGSQWSWQIDQLFIQITQIKYHDFYKQYRDR